MAGPLAGIRVIDLTTMVSGPQGTMTLADQGADVIKVETPTGGDYTRHVATRRGGFSASFLNSNRNKRSVILDLKAAEGLEAIKRLLNGADVFIQNFRPGVAERIGLGEQAVREIAPSIIYVSVCGFGHTGPYADKPVFDPLIQAVSGLTTLQGGSDEAKPRLVRTILPDKLTAIQSAQAICAALFERERSGKGQHIQLSMLDTLVAFLWSSDMGGHTFVGDEVTEETAQSFIDLIYETADGYVSVAVMQDKHWAGLADAVEYPEFLTDARFKSPALREENKDARTQLMQDVMRPYQTKDLIARLEAHDVPCSPVLRRRDMIRHAQVEANDLLRETDHPYAGRLRQTRAPAVFSRTTNEHRYGAPGYGEHSREILRQSGLNDEQIDGLIEKGVVREFTPDRSEQS